MGLATCFHSLSRDRREEKKAPFLPAGAAMACHAAPDRKIGADPEVL
jgi:hypothetical protein